MIPKNTREGPKNYSFKYMTQNERYSWISSRYISQGNVRLEFQEVVHFCFASTF